MRLPTLQETIEINTRAQEYNNKIRPKNEWITAEKEKRFIRAAAGGMFLMWNPYPSAEETTASDTDKQENNPPGLPTEIGQYIGSFFTKKDAAKLTLVCTAAYNAAKSDVNQFVWKHGDVKKEIPFTPLYHLLF